MASSEDPLRAWRIVSPRWADNAFSGEGARKYGGRWNSPGRAVVYLAGSRALAALEMLVHLTTPGSRAKPYVLIEARVPRELVAEPARKVGGPVASGDRWIDSRRSLALRVPSVLIPQEPNYLLNPSHPEFRRVRIGLAEEFRFDPRL